MWRASYPRGSVTTVAALLIACIVLLPSAAHAQAPEKGQKPPAGRAGILDALAAPTQFDFVEVPLSDVVDSLKDRHEIEIQVDRSALEDGGIDLSTSITRSLKGITLESALNLILRELDLTWTVTDEVVLITTPDVAEGIQETEVYDVTSLAAAQDGSAAELAEAVSAAIEPPSWSESGGSGVIRAVKIGDSQKLVVTHTFRTHRKIQELLSKLSASGIPEETGSHGHK